MRNLTSTARLGIQRGWIEFKAMYFKNPKNLIVIFLIAVAFVTVLWFQRHTYVKGVSLALFTFPGLLAIQIVQEGLSNVAGVLSYDKEDGTLLRAKTIPQGMTAYFVARVVLSLLSMTFNLLLLFVLSLFVVHGLFDVSLLGICKLIGLVIFGLLTTAPIGAIIGAATKNARSSSGLTMLPTIAAVAVSGIFYPITALPGWLQVIGQFFPVYWLGLGIRSVFLPHWAAVLEIGGSWRTVEMCLVLVAWAVAGLFVAPRMLRTMTRRASGSNMEAIKQRVMRRGY